MPTRGSRERSLALVVFWSGILLIGGARYSAGQPVTTTAGSASFSRDPGQPAVSLRVSSDATSAALTSMYATFVALQGLDLQSTVSAVRRGGVEGNPVMGLSTASPYLVALKSVSAFGVALTTEKISKEHKVTALIMMVGLNIGYSMIVAHNLSVAR
jgi:hypothetical protein